MKPRRKRAATAANDNAEPVMLAWRCVVLAVDTARVSGWAIRASGHLLSSGEVDTLEHGDVAEIIELAEQSASVRKLPLVLVLEKPWGGMMSTIVALGMARERWLQPWRAAGLPRKRVVSVMPASWRARVLGRGYARATREQVRDAEAAAARTLETKSSWGELGADECAAILISRWATYAPQVGAVLPAAVRELSRPTGQLTLVDVAERRAR